MDKLNLFLHKIRLPLLQDVTGVILFLSDFFHCQQPRVTYPVLPV